MSKEPKITFIDFEELTYTAEETKNKSKFKTPPGIKPVIKIITPEDEENTKRAQLDGVDYIYIEIKDAKKSAETGNTVFLNHHNEVKKFEKYTLMVIEAYNNYYPEEFIQAILKKPAIRVTKRVKEEYIRASDPWKFVSEYVYRHYVKPKEDVIDRLHKQPRTLLKTVAKSIANTTDEPTLFTLPQRVEATGVISSLKEELTKNTGALALYLMQLYQQNGCKPLEIKNLSPIAEVMNCNNYRVKLYLLHLGGYTYPIIDRDEKTRELVISNEQLFKIQFRYSPAVGDKYSTNSKGEVQGVERIGNNFLNFIKDEPTDNIIITPNERFIKALEGRGLGNILTVNDKFIGLILELTDIATKILTYSSSNTPNQKISEDRLIEHLGLTKQKKAQGKPRVRATILKGLQELQDKGHIKSYSFDEDKGLYYFTYSDKYVRYKESRKSPKDTPEGVQ